MITEGRFSWKNLVSDPFYHKIVWVVIGLLTAVPLIRVHIEQYIKIILVWGAVSLIYLFAKKRLEFRRLEKILLLLFCVSYGITILVNWGNHTGDEIPLLAYTVIFLFLLTCCDRRKTRQEIQKEIFILFKIVIAFTFVYSCISFVMFLISAQGYIKLPDTKFPYGMWESRLWGLYNPNTGGVLNYISVIFSWFVLKWDKLAKKIKIFLWMNIILQCCCFALAQSRGAMVAAVVFTAGYVFFVRKTRRTYAGIKNWLYRFVLALFAVIILQIGNSVILSGMEFVREAPRYVASIFDPDAIKSGKDLEKLKRKVDSSSAAGETSGRSDLWALGLKSYRENFVFGIGQQSIDDVLKEGLSEEWYENSASGGLHCIYITILTSCGTVGAVFIAGFWFILLRKGLKYVLLPNGKDFIKSILLLLPAWLAGDLVESRIILSTSYLAVFFWIMTGYMMYYLQKEKKEVKTDGYSNCSDI